MKNLKEINARKEELRSLLQSNEDVNLEEIEKELSQLEEMEKSIEKRQSIAKDITLGKIDAREIDKPSDKSSFDESDILSSKEYRSAYLKSLQGNILSEIEQRAMTTAASSVGSAVPTVTLNKIIEKLKQESVVLPLVTVLNIPSNVSMPIEGTINDVSIKGEGVASTDSADTLGTPLTLTAYKLIKTISITAEVKAMTIDAFETFIVAQLVKKIKALVDYLIINGTGSSQPTGILTALTGTTSAIETAASSGFTYADFMKMLGALKAQYARNAIIMANRKFIYENIASIVGQDGQPIFKVETDGRFEGKAMGYKILCNDDVPDNKVLFGDFDYYFWNWVQQPNVEADKSVGFRSGDICYRVMALADGDLGLSEAFVLMSKKA